jgi:hypothetical protein
LRRKGAAERFTAGDVQFTFLKQLIAALDRDEYLALRRHMLGVGGNKCGDYVSVGSMSAGDAAGRKSAARRCKAFFELGLELALPATLKGTTTRPAYRHILQQPSGAANDGKPARVGSARDVFLRAEVAKLQAAPEGQGQREPALSLIAAMRWAALTAAEKRSWDDAKRREEGVYALALGRWREARKAGAPQSATAAAADGAADDSTALTEAQLGAVVSLFKDTLGGGVLKGQGAYLVKRDKDVIEDGIAGI